ncbi:MAG: response regulator [Candidatus Obscuribacterales bacterium]|jgi:DNA-binding response OmpR family regulator|nr:response regulator [Candidatus Obscuribacterales bacterium]
MCVLIVEDDATLGMVYKRNLDKLGLKSYIAVTGEEAIAEIQSSGVDYGLVLLDIGLPQMDGLSVAQGMRELGTDCPIIAITAGHSSKEECLKSGMDDYFTKPVFMKELESIIHKWDVGRCPGEGSHRKEQSRKPS